MKEVSINTFEEMKAVNCIVFDKNNKNYGKTKRKRQVEEGAYESYLTRIKEFIIVSKTIFKELVDLGYLVLDEKNTNCFRTPTYSFVNKAIYNEYKKYL